MHSCTSLNFASLIPRTLRIRLITALIFPVLDYCCTAMTDLNGKLDLKLQRALNSKCVRYIFPVRWDGHVTPYLRDLRWLRVGE